MAPGIDGLVRIADHADVAVLAGHLSGQAVLNYISVLKLVDKQVAVAVGVPFKGVGGAIEELTAFRSTHKSTPLFSPRWP